jgi:hypothetical protein
MPKPFKLTAMTGVVDAALREVARERSAGEERL